MKTIYKTHGTCSSLIETEVEDGIIKSVRYSGGCPGNLLAISILVKGMPVQEAIDKLDGLKCGNKRTSCADQLAQALKEML